MKKYLLLIENEHLWEEFKKVIDKDINSEILELIEEKIKSNKGGKKWFLITREDNWLFLWLSR